MRIKLNLQKEGEWRKSFAWFPIWTEDEIIWWEYYEHQWVTANFGGVVRYYRKPLMP